MATAPLSVIFKGITWVWIACGLLGQMQPTRLQVVAGSLLGSSSNRSVHLQKTATLEGGFNGIIPCRGPSLPQSRPPQGSFPQIPGISYPGAGSFSICIIPTTITLCSPRQVAKTLDLTRPLVSRCMCRENCVHIF